MTKSLTYVEIETETFIEQSPSANTTWRFAMDTGYLPTDIEAIPSVRDVSFKPATISLGKDLGERAEITVRLKDHKHIMASESYDSGTFFGKFRGRYGAKLRGRPFRLIRGQLGQDLEEMDTRHYIIDSTDGPSFDGIYTIKAKDVLKFADNDRAQAPDVSNGRLAGNIDDSTTSATLSPAGIGNTEYTANGFICLGGKEVVSFTRSGDSLTISRGELGTVPREHESDDRAQLCLRYTGDDVADIVADLLENYADVPSDYIPLSEWQDETADNLSVIYARTITEPTSVNKLISELIEQAALTLWWDDRARRLRLKVLREISTDADEFDEDRILENSFSVKEQPDKRISQIWTYYGQRDPTDRADNEDNYRAALAEVDLTRETDYGSPEIRKILGNWVATEAAAQRLNGIQLSRFRDPPRKFGFSLFRGETIQPADGYQLNWWGSQNAQGQRESVPIQITRVKRTDSNIQVEAEEMLASGVIVVTHTVFLTDTGGLENWEVPETWNNSNNEVVCIGGGGAGYSRGGGGSGGHGGGGGAFSRSQNITLSGNTVPYRVGIGGIAPSSGNGQDGGDSFFGNTSLASAIVGAEGGQGGTGRTSGGQGGQASNGVGDLKTSGGNGGQGAPEGETRAGGGGAGGAGGPHGDGANGGNLFSVSDDDGAGGAGADGGEDGESQDGGNGGDNRFGYGGGNSETPTGQEGGGGKGGNGGAVGEGGNGEQIWTQTVAPIISAGPGGGGGGAKYNTERAGHGGNFGGAGGGSGERTRGGDGAQGIIVIRWREAEA